MEYCCSVFKDLMDSGMAEIEPEKYQSTIPIVTFRTHGWLVRESKKEMRITSLYVHYCPFCGQKFREKIIGAGSNVKTILAR